MYKLTASYNRNGTATDTTNAASLGEYLDHEFESDDDALGAAMDLHDAGLDVAINISVEDIGITEDEVATKSGDEWWGIMVGAQTPAEFMDGETDAREAALSYLSQADVFSGTICSSFRDEAAKSDLVDKLAEVIEAQGIESIDYVYQGDDLGEHSGTWTGPRADAVEAAVDALGAEEVDGDYVYDDDASDAKWVNTSDELATLGAALLDGHDMSAAYSLWCAATGGDEYVSQWDALSADAEERGMDVSEDTIVFATNEGGGHEGWLTLNDGVIYVCEGGQRHALPTSSRTIAAALPLLPPPTPATSDIEALMAEAGRAGATEMVTTCECARVIAEAAACR